MYIEWHSEPFTVIKNQITATKILNKSFWQELLNNYVLMMFSCLIVLFLQVLTVSPCHSDHLGLTNEEAFLMNHVNYIPYPNRYKIFVYHLNL